MYSYINFQYNVTFCSVLIRTESIDVYIGRPSSKNRGRPLIILKTQNKYKKIKIKIKMKEPEKDNNGVSNTRAQPNPHLPNSC